jgi:para-aminobenzoate synthetase/4-amino-4-deoxychorismate lyase
MEISINFENRPISFKDPHSIIRCSDPQDLSKAFEKIEEYLNSGYHVAGFLSYEAGYRLEERLIENKKYDFPLLMFGVYKKPQYSRPKWHSSSIFKIQDLDINISPSKYSENIERIREHISWGDVYQITYCIKLKFNFKGDERSLFRSLFNAQPVPYSALIETDDFRILSLSPERFIKKNKNHILTEPMKGTWTRGRNPISDMIERYKFSKDKKNRAENIMIADLLRNDLGRVGTDIDWPKIYTITKYKTLYQMTSTVTGKVDKNIKLYDLMAAIFPSGSVTGAPRIRAMEIIKEIEKEERKIYTGAIGYITPGRDMYFNIPIRTLLIKNGAGEMGIGGGIVWDSTPQGEWDEGLLKAKFLTDMDSSFRK